MLGEGAALLPHGGRRLLPHRGGEGSHDSSRPGGRVAGVAGMVAVSG